MTKYKTIQITPEYHAKMARLAGRNKRTLAAQLEWMIDREEKNTMVINQHGKAIDFQVAVNHMDDNLREEIHADLAPTTEQQFFDEYARRHAERFGETWELDKANPIY